MGFRVALCFIKPFLWFLVDFGCGVVVVVVEYCLYGLCTLPNCCCQV